MYVEMLRKLTPFIITVHTVSEICAVSIFSMGNITDREIFSTQVGVMRASFAVVEIESAISRVCSWAERFLWDVNEFLSF